MGWVAATFSWRQLTAWLEPDQAGFSSPAAASNPPSPLSHFQPRWFSPFSFLSGCLFREASARSQLELLPNHPATTFFSLACIHSMCQLHLCHTRLKSAAGWQPAHILKSPFLQSKRNDYRHTKMKFKLVCIHSLSSLNTDSVIVEESCYMGWM